MKAITIRQPHAWALFEWLTFGTNRTWDAKHYGVVSGEIIAIHAHSFLPCHDDVIPQYDDQPKINSLKARSIIGVAKFVSCWRIEDIISSGIEVSDRCIGPFCHFIDPVKLFDFPIMTTGGLGYWDVPSDLEAKIRKKVRI